jgi:hypothetical protein
MSEFWYNDGAGVRKALELYYNDGTAVRKAREVWYNDGAAVRKVFSGFTVASPALSSSMEPGAAFVTFLTDGSISASDGGSFAWGTPSTVGVGAGYWVNVVVGSGNGVTTNGPYSTWLQLSANRTFGINSATGVSGVTRTRNMTYQIATDASGVNVVASGAIFLSSTVP